MCRGVTKAGKQCRSKAEPYCKHHAPAAPLSNADAFEQLVDALRAKDALLVSEAIVQLGRTLAGDMDSGEAVHCHKCKMQVSVTRNAALVKQYREVIEVLASDDSADDDTELWEKFHAAGRNSG